LCIFLIIDKKDIALNIAGYEKTIESYKNGIAQLQLLIHEEEECRVKIKEKI